MPFQHSPGSCPSSPQVTSIRLIRRTGTSVTLRDPAQHGALLVLGHPGQRAAVDRDDPRRPVGDQRPAHVVDDQPALRLHDDLADRLGGGLGGVLLPRRPGGGRAGPAASRTARTRAPGSPPAAAGCGARRRRAVTPRPRSGSSRSSRPATQRHDRQAEQRRPGERRERRLEQLRVRRRRGRAAAARSARRPRCRRTCRPAPCPRTAVHRLGRPDARIRHPAGD